VNAADSAASLHLQPLHRIAAALQGEGLRLDVGHATLCVHSLSPHLPAQLQAVYRHFPFMAEPGWADVHCRLDPAPGLRRWLKPQVVFISEAASIFSPFPAEAPLPLFEWGCNWLLGHRMNDRLLLHAGALERDGLALLLPATPGSGKSTLTAALSLRGWRLLSDEFGVVDPDTGLVHAMLKPVALKNESIAVIRGFEPSAALGPLFPKTRKGTVAHLAAAADAVTRRHEPARPAAVVLPRWEAGSPTHLEPVTPDAAFAALAFNAFNYQLLGEAGFDAVVRLARQCLAWQLVYSDLDDAIATLDRAWHRVREAAGR
jgi:HprK-related kinase A